MQFFGFGFEQIWKLLQNVGVVLMHAFPSRSPCRHFDGLSLFNSCPKISRIGEVKVPHVHDGP
jgi:hypothetical protein